MDDHDDTPNQTPLPIPPGALASRQVRSLGNGIHILNHCYAIVDADGTLQLNLEQVAKTFDATYPTVKRWWGKLRDSGILKDITRHGRNGISARFDTHWLDWHILAQRVSPLYPTEETHGIAVAAKTAPVAQETGRSQDGNGNKTDPKSANRPPSGREQDANGPPSGQEQNGNGSTIAPVSANGPPSGRQQDANERTYDPVFVNRTPSGQEQNGNGTETGSQLIPNFPVYMVLGEDEESRSLSSSPPPVPNPPAHAHEADTLGPLGRAVMGMQGVKSAKAALAVQKSCLQAGTDLPTLQASMAILKAARWNVGQIIERLKLDPPAPGHPYPAPAEDPAYEQHNAYRRNAHQHDHPGARAASARKNERSRLELERIDAAHARSAY